MDILFAPFMLRALIAAAVTGLAAPAVGTYLVQRRLSLMGDGIGHVCVTGVALGLLTGTSPTLTAVIVVAIARRAADRADPAHRQGDRRRRARAAVLRRHRRRPAAGLARPATASFALQQYLFGSITTISPSAVVASVALAAVVLVLVVRAAARSCSRSPTTRTSPARPGCRCAFYNVLISVLAAVTVSVAMRTVGLLLVSALMVIPVATAQQFARGFQVTMLGAMVAGHAGRRSTGVAISAFADVPPGATIVLVSLAGFALDLPARAGRAAPPAGADAVPGARRARRRRTTPSTSRTGTSTARLRPPGGRARRPRRLHPRRPPARGARRAL